MSDERPTCWQCAEGAMKDAAEIERLRDEIAELRLRRLRDDAVVGPSS